MEPIYRENEVLIFVNFPILTGGLNQSGGQFVSILPNRRYIVLIFKYVKAQILSL